jgi:hypothetical protein
MAPFRRSGIAAAGVADGAAVAGTTAGGVIGGGDPVAAGGGNILPRNGPVGPFFYRVSKPASQTMNGDVIPAVVRGLQ